MKALMEPTTLVTPRGVDFQMEVATRHRPWYEESGYEPLTTSLWQRLSRLSDQIVDIGAHVGWYSIQAARSNPEALVIAVEGDPQTAEVCQSNCVAIVPDRVVVRSGVFASRPGIIDFHVTEASDNSSRSGHPSSPTIQILQRPALNGRELGLEPGRSLLVKIDVEGHELDALEGLAEEIDASSVTRLVLELNPKCLDQAGSSAIDVLMWLRERGFKIYVVDDRARRWGFVHEHQAVGELVPEGGYANLYCVRGTALVAADLVLHSSALGGAERTTLSMVERLSSAGHLIHCRIPVEDAGLGSRLEAAGATVSEYPGRWWAQAGRGSDWTQAAAGLDLILADLRDFPPEVIVSITGVVPVGAVAAHLAGLPHVWSLHEYLDDDHGLILPASRRDVGRFIREHSSIVVANSDSVAQHVLGRPADRVVPPLDLADVMTIPQGEGREGPPRVLGFFSALNPGKGLTDLIEATARLLREGRDLVLNVYGEGAPEETAFMAALAEDLGIADRLNLRGRSGNPYRAMAEVDVVVVPSRREAFGRVPIEAIFVGRPVVYARGGGMDDYMRDGVTGVACEPHDPADLADALARVLDDRQLRQTLAESARPALESWLGRADRGEAWASLLFDALAGHPPATWSERARSTLILEANQISVSERRHLTEDLLRTRQQLDLIAKDREAVDADRHRLHLLAESSRAEAEDLRGRLQTLEAQLSATLAEMDRIRGTVRYRATFGWRSRLKIQRTPPGD